MIDPTLLSELISEWSSDEAHNKRKELVRQLRGRVQDRRRRGQDALRPCLCGQWHPRH